MVENLRHGHMILTINNTILETRYNLNARKKIIYLRSYKAGFNFLKWEYVIAISFICSKCRQQFPEQNSGLSDYFHLTFEDSIFMLTFAEDSIFI